MFNRTAIVTLKPPGRRGVVGSDGKQSAGILIQHCRGNVDTMSQRLFCGRVPFFISDLSKVGVPWLQQLHRARIALCVMLRRASFVVTVGEVHALV